MGKNITRKMIEEELASTLESNTTIKAASLMVGFDVDGQSEKLLASADQRVRMNIHQQGRIRTLESLLNED